MIECSKDPNGDLIRLNQTFVSSNIAGSDRNRLGSKALPAWVETHRALLLNLWMGVRCKSSAHSEYTKKSH